MKLRDREALAIRDYARAPPFKDVDTSAVSAAAELQTSDGAPQQPSASPAVPDDQGGGASSSSGPDVVMPQSALGSIDAVRHSDKHETDHDDVGAEAKRLHFSDYDDVPHGNMVPQTPASVPKDGLDDTP